MISVIIPNLHSPLIGAVIAALRRQTARAVISEIIIVGQDRHGQIPTDAPDVLFITPPHRLQQGAARNLGKQYARGAYLLFLDADCIPQPDLVAQILTAHQQGYPVVGGAIVLADLPNEVHGWPRYWMQCDNALTFAHALSSAPAGLRQSLASHTLSMQRETLLALGGFREEDGEDHDLSYRMRQAGIPMYFTPHARVAHHHPRRSAHSVWAHLRDFGHTAAKLWGWHPQLSRDPQRLRRYVPAMIALALPLALRDVLLLVLRAPYLWAYPQLWAGMVWGKWAWYIGVAERLRYTTTPRPPVPTRYAPPTVSPAGATRMTPPLNVSVIIPNLHSPHLGDLLTALAQQTRPPDQVIVVGQDRYSFAAQHPPSAWLQWISTPRPVSPALARNIGIAHARGDVLCFIDADCIPAPDWLAHLLAEYQHGRQVVIGAVAIGGPEESFWQRCDNILALGEYLQTAPAGTRAYLYTANVVLARELFRTVGLFDLRYQRAAGEDTDLALRLRPHTPLYFTPAALVQHRTNRTTARAVWQHLWGYGQQWAALHDYGAAGLHRSLWQRLARVAPPLAWLLVPVLVLRDIARLYRLQPALLRRYPLTAAAVALLRGASYHGQYAYWHSRSKPHA